MGSVISVVSCIARDEDVDNQVDTNDAKYLYQEVHACLKDTAALKNECSQVFARNLLLNANQDQKQKLSRDCAKELTMNMVCKLDCNNVTVVKKVHNKFEELEYDYPEGLDEEIFAKVTEEVMTLIEANLRERFMASQKKEERPRCSKKILYIPPSKRTLEADEIESLATNMEFSAKEVRKQQMLKERMENDKAHWREVECAFIDNELFRESMTIEQAKKRCFEIQMLRCFSFRNQNGAADGHNASDRHSSTNDVGCANVSETGFPKPFHKPEHEGVFPTHDHLEYTMRFGFLDDILETLGYTTICYRRDDVDTQCSSSDVAPSSGANGSDSGQKEEIVDMEAHQMISEEEQENRPRVAAAKKVGQSVETPTSLTNLARYIDVASCAVFEHSLLELTAENQVKLANALIKEKSSLENLAGYIEAASFTDIEQHLLGLTADNRLKLAGALFNDLTDRDWTIVAGSIGRALLVEEKLTLEQAKFRLAQLRGVQGFFCEDLLSGDSDQMVDVTFIGDGELVAAGPEAWQCTTFLMPVEKVPKHFAVPTIPSLFDGLMSRHQNDVYPDESASVAGRKKRVQTFTEMMDECE